MRLRFDQRIKTTEPDALIRLSDRVTKLHGRDIWDELKDDYSNGYYDINFLSSSENRLACVPINTLQKTLNTRPDAVMNAESRQPLMKEEGALPLSNETAQKEETPLNKLDQLISLLEKRFKFSILFKVNAGDGGILDIVSTEDEILSLPWELYYEQTFLNQNIFCRRVVPTTEKVSEIDCRNFLVYASYACDKDQGYPNISHGIRNELKKVNLAINETLHNLLENTQRFDCPNIFHVSRFINRTIMTPINAETFKNVHLIAHGEKGRIAFETAANNWAPDWIANKELINLLKSYNQTEYPFKLLFYSACYSAYADNEITSATYESINARLSRYAIGFGAKMGSNWTLPGFSEKFYGYYMANHSVEESFRKALQQLISEKSKYWHVPRLYKGEYL